MARKASTHLHGHGVVPACSASMACGRLPQPHVAGLAAGRKLLRSMTMASSPAAHSCLLLPPRRCIDALAVNLLAERMAGKGVCVFSLFRLHLHVRGAHTQYAAQAPCGRGTGYLQRRNHTIYSLVIPYVYFYFSILTHYYYITFLFNCAIYTVSLEATIALCS